ncbi:kinase-like protein [Daldinia eschscholtzii]|nr:kinase-like protein [Daldinia eschscholtzii]
MAALNSFERAQRLIQGAGFVHPDAELLMSFLVESVDNERAANYLLGICDSSEDNVSGLSIVLSRWKSLIAIFCHGLYSRVYEEEIIKRIKARDSVCFLTGRKSSWKDPLIVTEIFPSISGRIRGPLREMLAAFLSPTHEDFLETHEATTSNPHPPDSNIWLVRSSAASAFSQGFFQVNIFDRMVNINTTFVDTPRCPTIVRNANYFRRTVLSSKAMADCTHPNTIALDILSRLAHPIRWVCFPEAIPPGYACNRVSNAHSLHKPPTWFAYILNACISSILAFWLLFPVSLRIMMYRFLTWLGSRIYQRTNSFKVRRLPFGLYLKKSSKERHTSLSNEFKTLDLLRRQTDIPVPRPLDLASDSENTYLLTSRVPGKPIGLCIDFLNDKQLRIFARDLRNCLKKVRNLQKDPTLPSTISNTAGEACYDGRIMSAVEYDETRGDFFGPFSTEAEFNKILKSPHIPDVVHRDGHKIVFTHGDINLRNVLVDEKSGRLSGIVDWETSGWYPDYWEYTKAHYATRLKWRWLRDVIEVVFKDFGDFSEDLEIERMLWWYCW